MSYLQISLWRKVDKYQFIEQKDGEKMSQQIEDIIYEKDYRQRPADEADLRSSQILEQAINGGFFEAYKKEMDAIPKVIVPEDKANYEYLLERCDEFAERHRGYIKGVVDYHKWQSEIVMTLSFAEFDDPEDLAFLGEIAKKSHTVTFEPSEEGGIRVRIFINYFDELMTDDHRAYVQYNAIMDDERLATALGMDMLSPEQEEAAQRLKEILDRFDAETTFDRTTVFKALLARMSKVDKEHLSLDMMVAFAEKLLEITLEKEDEVDE